jgi:hypothetical protein
VRGDVVWRDAMCDYMVWGNVVRGCGVGCVVRYCGMGEHGVGVSSVGDE